MALDVSLPHLDRFFDYTVPAKLEADAVVGARVRARFAGRLVDGFIVERPDSTLVTMRLRPLSKVVSPESVLSERQVTLIRAVADHYAGTFADVARLAVPPRHAATEKASPSTWPAPELPAELPGGLLSSPGGPTYLEKLESGQGVRAAWQVTPSFSADGLGPDDWTRGVVQAAVATLRAGRGVIVVVPDDKDVTRALTALAAALGRGCLAELRAGLGVATRYRNYLALSRGLSRIVVGTRAAVYAPVANLGLMVVVDDGDDLLAERHAPYPHSRDVAALRAVEEGCGLLLASYARSSEVQAWVERGWVAPIALPGKVQRRRSPAVRVTGDSDVALARDPLAHTARLPALAFATIRKGLAEGPVLVQVPRSGYVLALSCQRCRAGVRCPACHGPVRLTRPAAGGRQMHCGWCGRMVVNWACTVCGGRELRAPLVGSTRTAEELGRAFPGYRLIDSSGDRVVATVGDQPALVVATPGGEPIAEHGYSAALLLDASLSLGRADLRAGEETLRRWCNALALVRPGEAGGTVCVVGPPQDRAVQALVRVDPAGFAARELAERRDAGFPPAVRLVQVEATPGPLTDFLASLDLPSWATLLGPVDLPAAGAPRPSSEGDEPLQRALLRCDLEHGPELSRLVKAGVASRSARKAEGLMRVRVDPVSL